MPAIRAVPVVMGVTVTAAVPVVPLVAKPLGMTPRALTLPRMVVVVATPVPVVPVHLVRPDKDRRPHIHRRGLHVHGPRLHVHRGMFHPGRAALEAN